MERHELEALLAGKVIARAELGPRTVVLAFTDGTLLVREKTFEGLTRATLFGTGGETIATAVLS
ncbi:MAG: hypothetical protein ACM3X6_10630 [Patescibacteria group bacterium]